MSEENSSPSVEDKSTEDLIEKPDQSGNDVEKVETDTSEKKEEKKEESVEEEEIIEMVEIPKKRLDELVIVEERVLEEIKLERANSINYRKRLEKQRDEFVEIASVRVLSKLLAVKDDLDRIVENGKDEIPENHFKGIELLQQRTEGIFNQEGVTIIKIEVGKTKYDPKFHEAIVAQPVEDVVPNTILSIVNAGFQKGDRVLRASKVIISKSIEGPKKEEESSEEFKEAEDW